jgi:hypothetical protein
MKRSEAVKKISKLVETYCANIAMYRIPEEQFASMILEQMEQLGMLPPKFDTEYETYHVWEPEDSK